MKLEFRCPNYYRSGQWDVPCGAELELEQYDGECKCWFCGQSVIVQHDCYASGDCDDYCMRGEDL